MTTVAEPIADQARPARPGATPLIELIVLATVVAVAAVTYFVIARSGEQGRLLSPLTGSLLLLANLAPVVTLMVLIGRRVAIHRATRAGMAFQSRLHVRLVALFSVVASVPIVLTAIAASVIVQPGAQFWQSDRARNVFNSSIKLAEEGQELVAKRWAGEARGIIDDIGRYYPRIPIGSQEFQAWFAGQTYFRNLEQSVLFIYEPGKPIQPLYRFNPPPEAQFSRRVNGRVIEALKKANQLPYVTKDSQAIWVLSDVPGTENLFLYVGTSVNVDFLNKQVASKDAIDREYAALLKRAQAIQLQFNAALFFVALLIIGLAIIFALAVADRLVRPIEELVGAARRVAGGDLTARVPEPDTMDEIGTLGSAFNQMTERLQQQTDALESRRALTEAVLSGVSAGVIAIASDRSVRLANASATSLLKVDDESLVGRSLQEIAPELDALLDSNAHESIVQITIGGEARTLAVRVTRDEGGQVLTFDDITQQLLDQRRAAWSDVARRIAHEIKNPLTPIQLAAERLQRRYGKQVDGEDTVFARLTDTIVRQVGDLRRMVDEFSSFARMPKPIFRQESLVDLGRQALFLHEVAHPNIRFSFDHPEPTPQLVCDRRQIGQALTNIVKNAVEAIEARGEGAEGEIAMSLCLGAEHHVIVRVADNGIGLPLERDRIVEPYMTTRSRGTGLGLAIVKKIVEEHFGTISFDDRPGGGTIVTIDFDTALLDTLATDAAGDGDTRSDDRPAHLTRTGTAKA